jgi:nucleoside-diphosphate kinase
MLKVESKSKSKLAEQTLIIIKPDAVKRDLVGEILSRFEKKEFSISKLKMFNFTTEMAEQFYSVHSSKPFFGELVSFITSGRVAAAIIEGENVINMTREIIGKTNPKEASPGTIRGDFGSGILENSIHASDSRESFDKEVNVVFS